MIFDIVAGIIPVSELTAAFSGGFSALRPGNPALWSAAALPLIAGNGPVRLLGLLFRGYPLLYPVYSLLLAFGRTESTRLRAVIGLGKAGNPASGPALLEALDDPGAEVRREAALSLGKVRAVRATVRLIRELEDRESDIRAEAAEALGSIGDRSALPALLQALGDPDLRLRNAAVSALAALGDREARERLTDLFVHSSDSDLFPALADSLSRLGERGIVEPVMRRLGEYESIVLRLQLLNAVCRALGTGNEFYRILSHHEYARVDEVNRLIRRARRDVRRAPVFRREAAGHVGRILHTIAESYSTEEHRAFLRSVWEFMAHLQLVIPELVVIDSPESGERRNSLRPFIEAVNRYLVLKETEDIRDEGMVFLVLCITCLLRELRRTVRVIS